MLRSLSVEGSAPESSAALYGPAVDLSPEGRLTPLAHPSFRWLLGGRVIDALGNAVAPIALAFALLDSPARSPRSA